MNISQSELLAHPLMKQVSADIAESRAKRQAEQTAQQMEALRLRGEQGRYLLEQFEQARQDYERLRRETHAAVGAVWKAAQDYSRLTGSNPPDFLERAFNEINLPTLIPDLRPWGALHSPATTTQASVMGWFATTGREWT